jgi:hypothetical protein
MCLANNNVGDMLDLFSFLQHFGDKIEYNLILFQSAVVMNFSSPNYLILNWAFISRFFCFLVTKQESPFSEEGSNQG